MKTENTIKTNKDEAIYTDLKLDLDIYLMTLKRKKKAESTIKLYKKVIEAFIEYIEANELGLNYESLESYRNYLSNDYICTRTKKPIKPETIDKKIICLNAFLDHAGYSDCKIERENIQETHISKNILEFSEYERLVNTAFEYGYIREALLMQTLANTGIRISELKFFTVEALNDLPESGFLKVDNKGKKRDIIVPKEIKDILLEYAKENNILSGIIFRNRKGGLIDTANLHRKLKKLAELSNIDKDKVHAHNFRKIFSVNYLKRYSNDITNLADLLGHKSLETTRIYLQLSQNEMSNRVNELSKTMIIRRK